jgi:hypothetical protein
LQEEEDGEQGDVKRRKKMWKRRKVWRKIK